MKLNIPTELRDLVAAAVVREELDLERRYDRGFNDRTALRLSHPEFEGGAREDNR